MPRQRMVKPDFFDSESLGQCNPISRLTFIGLWVMSDDYGNQKAQIKRLRHAIFPYDEDMTDIEFASFLCELEAVGCIIGYEVEGERYISIPNFSTYQTIRKPSNTSNPEPPAKAKKGSDALIRKWFSPSDELVTNYGGTTPPVQHYDGTSAANERMNYGSNFVLNNKITEVVGESCADADKPAPLSPEESCGCPDNINPYKKVVSA